MNAKIATSVSTILLAAILFSCRSDRSQEHKSVKYRQYYIKGEALYQTHCSNCHQKDGTGLALLYPPLNQSDYMKQNVRDVICLIRNGKAGALVVNGRTYNMRMPAFPNLTDLDVAQISTYIYNSWEHDRGLIDVRDVTTTLSNCADTR